MCTHVYTPHTHTCVHIPRHTYSYTHKHIDTNTHTYREIAKAKEMPFICQEEVAVEALPFPASVRLQVSEFYICTRPPAELLSPAHWWTREQHTIRLLSGAPVSLWDRAVEWFFICSFFMLHWPISTPFRQFWALCRAKGELPSALKSNATQVIYH